jgi:mannose-6-phosphate isomerase-like protein (cupin superfamily)
MRAAVVVFVALGLAAPALAQPSLTPRPVDRTYVSSAEIAAIMNKIGADVAGGKPGGGARVLQFGGYASNLEYRTTVGTSGLHEAEDELFFVVDGSGVLVTGGKLIDPKRQDARNLLGSGVEGGVSRTVGKGDTFVVLKNTPHWFSAINGRLVMISMRLPEAPTPPQP